MDPNPPHRFVEDTPENALPDDWQRFEVGEEITHRGVVFAIECIERETLTLRPVRVGQNRDLAAQMERLQADLAASASSSSESSS